MMKHLFLIVFFLVELSQIVVAQNNYQRKIYQTGTANSLSEVVFSGEQNTSSYVISNYSGTNQYESFATITKFNSNTGTVSSTKTYSISGSDFMVNGACKSNSDGLYMLASESNSLTQTGVICKYNLTSNSFTWRRKLNVSTEPFYFTSIAYDNDKFLYALGSVYDNTNGNNDLCITKLDTNGALIWVKILGESVWEETPNQIIYNGKRELYVSSVGFTGPFGKPTLIRLDSSGTVLNTLALSTSSSPRFGSNQMVTVNGKIICVSQTVVGPSDPGPVLIRVIDSSMVVSTNKIISGISVKSVFAKNNTILLSGQAPVTSGLSGFRSVRLDDQLNVIGSRYFNHIPTSSISSSSSCFINATNQSTHFFKSGGIDSVFVVKTDAFEFTSCRDTVYTPPLTTLTYTTIAFNYSYTPLTATLTTISIPITSSTFSTVTLCSGITTGISSSKSMPTVSVFPNPAQDVVYITDAENTFSSVFVTTVLGEEVMFVDKKEFPLNVGFLTNGIYFFHFLDAEKRAVGTSKLIKN